MPRRNPHRFPTVAGAREVFNTVSKYDLLNAAVDFLLPEYQDYDGAGHGYAVEQAAKRLLERARSLRKQKVTHIGEGRI